VVQVGDLAPDFELPDQSGNKVRLSNYLGKRVLLVFTRIFTDKIFCPLCFPHLNNLKKDYEDFKAKDVEVLVINSTPLDMTKTIAEEQGYPFPLLSDEHWEIYQLFGLGAAIGAPLPGQFLIDRDGKVLFVYTADSLPNHPENSEMFTLVDKVK
jgi:peroxiredoxin